MHSSGSILKTYCEKVRHYLDDPDLDAKYDDNYLVRFFLSSAMTDVISRVSQMSDAQVLSAFEITVVGGTNTYKLPPAVAQVIRVGTIESSSGLFMEDLKPRGQFNPGGPNWSIQGNTLVFQPVVNEDRTLTLIFVPSGDMVCHYEPTATGQIVSNGTFTMPSTVTLGSMDKRPNAYMGSYLRIFGSTLTDELLITDHDAALRILTPSTAFQNAIGFYSYEIVPFLLEPMIDAISVSAAMRAGVGRKISQAHMASLTLAYKQAVKTAHDTLGNMNGRLGKRFDGATIDSRRSFVSASSGASNGSSGGGTSGCDCNDVASETTQQQIIITLDALNASLVELSQQGVNGPVWGPYP